MKFKCSKRDLQSVLFQESKALAIKPQNPTLEGFYLSAQDNQLEVQANNLSLGMVATIPVIMEESGEVVVIGKKFIDVVKSLPGDDIDVSFNEQGNCLEISSGRSSYSIRTMPANEFTKVPRHEVANRIKIKAGVFKNLIKRTSFACASDHEVYRGCLFETKDDTLTVVATNMHRIAIAKDVLYEPAGELRFLVGADSLRNIVEMFPEDEDAYIEINYTGKTVEFTIGKIFVTGRIIDGMFPDYNKVIPQSSEIFVDVSVAEMRDAIDRVSIISREDPSKKMNFVFNGEELKIYADSPDFGTGEEVIDMTKQGSDLEIAFNYTYIADALKTLNSLSCRIALNGALDPIDIREHEGATDYIYVVTPVRP